mmetsp:Transcript_12482/g.38487  ORF Transcript_12482/g.38487 Transcript_12482/m.38487 type:complete len:402 (+) Transcript_12482:433-1638(+)
MAPAPRCLALLALGSLRCAAAGKEKAAADDVGVCVVFTHAADATLGSGTQVKEWQNLHDLLISLNALRAAGGPRTCVITNADAARVRRGLAKISDATIPIDDVVAAPAEDDVKKRFAAVLALSSPGHVRERVFARLTRIVAFARPPYAITLFLDDDMYACPVPGLAAALTEAASTVDVRLVERGLSQGEVRGASAAKAAKRVFSPEPVAPCDFVSDKVDLQGGAILVKRGPAAAAWASALADAFERVQASFNATADMGRDQPAHDAVAAQRCGVVPNHKHLPKHVAFDAWFDSDVGEFSIASLPTAFNLKLSYECARPVSHAVAGPVRILHYKGKKVAVEKALRAPALCAELNESPAGEAPRVARGFVTYGCGETNRSVVAVDAALLRALDRDAKRGRRAL